MSGVATGRPPRLAAGSFVTVRYYAGTAQFLHDRRRYTVNAYVNDGEYWSDVRTADRPCSGGTQYADGRLIDTSYWSRAQVRVATFVVLGLFGIATVILVVSLRRRTRRRAEFLRSGKYR